MILRRAIVALLAVGPLAVSPSAVAKTRVYVASQDDASVSQIDPESDRVLARIATGKGPAVLAADEAGKRIAVTHPDTKTIDVVETDTGKMRSLRYEGEPFGVAIDGDAIYVSDWSKNAVVRLDAASGHVTATAAVGKSPAGLAIDRQHHRLYVANRESGGISVLDCASMHVVADVPTGTAPFALGVAPDGSRVYVANVRSNDLAVVDTVRLKRVATVAAGVMPYGVAVTADNRTVLVTNQHSNTLTIVDAARLVVLATVAVGRYPEGVVSLEGRAFVANWFSGDVSVIDLDQRREITRIKVGDGPRNLVAMRDIAQDR